MRSKKNRADDTGDKASPGTPKNASKIIEHVYDVALDPVRYEELVDAWEWAFGPLRREMSKNPDRTYEDETMKAHLERASVFLDRFELANREDPYSIALADAGRNAAFVVDRSGMIVALNNPGEQLFDLSAGAALGDTPFDADDIAELRTITARVINSNPDQVVMLRTRRTGSDDAVFLKILHVKDAIDEPKALVVSSLLVWPPGFDVTLQDAFGVTAAEVGIIRGLAEGSSVADIAAARERSAQTVRTQLRSILSKTETHSQAELLRVTFGLMDAFGAPAGASAITEALPGKLQPISFQSITIPARADETEKPRSSKGKLSRVAARRYDYITFGAPNGRPCLYLPIDYGLIRWPVHMEAIALEMNLRVIVPVRAGFGHSDELPNGVDYTQETAKDLLCLVDHLGLSEFAILCLGADMRFALALGCMVPERVTGMVVCAGNLPALSPKHYERMHKWHRFILANARYAPKLLPFLVKAGFSLARRVGKEQFLRMVNDGSPSDMKIFDDPRVREAILLGSEVALSSWHSAHNAFARECIDSEKGWSDLVKRCQVPIYMLQGGEDPQTPRETVEDQMQEFPHLKVEIVEQAGQLIFFQEYDRVFELLEPLLPAPAN